MAMYGAPIWADALSAQNRALLRRSQRIVATRAIRGYRTVAFGAACALAGSPPWELEAEVLSSIYHYMAERRAGGDLPTSAEICCVRRDTDAIVMLRWAESLGSSEFGRRAIEAVEPVLRQWTGRKTGTLTFRVTQVLTGHGCFGDYLHKVAKREPTPKCHQCGAAEDSAQHTLEVCGAWADQRCALRAAVGEDLSLPSVVRAMVGTPFITPCKQSDSDCLKKSAQRALPVVAAGVADLGMEALDPMHISRIKSNQAGLQMDFKNNIVKGLRKCIVLNLSRNGNHINIKTKCSAVLIGDYNLDGKLLIMPISGNGKYKIKITDVVVNFSFNMDMRTSDDVVYWDFKRWEYDQVVEGNVHFQFQNLFNGNKELSDSIHEFANSNWLDIFNELSKPIMDSVMRKIVTEIRKLFDNVPLKDLVLD
ncbi:uncharacterized protein ACR2FA_010155 [Aphomia sociella]